MVHPLSTVRRVGVSAGPCTWDPQAESQEGLEAKSSSVDMMNSWAYTPRHTQHEWGARSDVSSGQVRVLIGAPGLHLSHRSFPSTMRGYFPNTF